MTQKRSVTLTFAPVTVNVSGDTNEKLLENAKKEFINNLSSANMPSIHSYHISAAEELSLDTVFAGQIVESLDGKLGIVSHKNKETINVMLSTGLTVTGSPILFKPSDARFNKARYRRTREDKALNNWAAGHSGYIKDDFGRHPVIVGKISRSKVKVYIIGANEFTTFTKDQLEQYVMDESSDF